MIDTQESITAKLCSFARAYHSNYGKEKIFDDYLAYDMMGKDEYEEIVQLIERDFDTSLCDMSLVDDVVKIGDNDAFSGAREFASKEGIFAGASSGAALAAAKRLIAGGARGNIVIILPDRGDRYFSKHLYK